MSNGGSDIGDTEQQDFAKTVVYIYRNKRLKANESNVLQDNYFLGLPNSLRVEATNTLLKTPLNIHILIRCNTSYFSNPPSCEICGNRIV